MAKNCPQYLEIDCKARYMTLQIQKEKVCFIVKAVYLSREKVSNFYHFHLRLQHVKIQSMDTRSTKEKLFWSFMRKKESADYRAEKTDGFGSHTAP